MSDLKVPILKKEAKVIFGSIIIQELQAAIALLSESIDSKSFQDKCDKKQFDTFTAAERVCIQLTSIVQQAYKQAESNGETYYSDVESTISSSLSSSSSV